MKRLGKKLTNIRVVEKILRSLNAKFNQVVIAIEEAKEKEYMSTDELNESLIAQEERMKRSQQVPVEQILQANILFNSKGNNFDKGRRSQTRGRGRGHWHGRGRGQGRVEGRDQGKDEQSSPQDGANRSFQRNHAFGQSDTIHGSVNLKLMLKRQILPSIRKKKVMPS
ncbi:UNVERIFIED_CONTAM: hypothetical protein Slati_3704800 [Sesamum latifolium]|uniref:Uncharacterized protein n=1 Tax=Sesamum latifolium TaxID=2727402 RepID=A0AAW2U601_9LAMI